MDLNGIKGIVMPIMTPFKEDGELDESLGCQIADFLIDGGVHGLFLLGSFGQGPAMRIDQRKRFAEVIVKHTRGRVPIVLHVGTADVFSTVELGLHARSLDCEAIAVVGPYYYSDHTEFEITEHYREVGARVGMPLMVYHNPPYSGYDITPPMMLRLKEQVPQICGMKYSADNLDGALSYLNQMPEDFLVYGLASGLMPGVLYGIKGTIVPTMISFPELSAALWRALEEKKLEEALALQVKVNEVRKTMRDLRPLYGEAVQCEAMRLRGLRVKRFPRYATKPLTAEHRSLLESAMRNVGIPTVP